MGCQLISSSPSGEIWGTSSRSRRFHAQLNLTPNSEPSFRITFIIHFWVLMTPQIAHSSKLHNLSAQDYDHAQVICVRNPAAGASMIPKVSLFRFPPSSQALGPPDSASTAFTALLFVSPCLNDEEKTRILPLQSDQNMLPFPSSSARRTSGLTMEMLSFKPEIGNSRCTAAFSQSILPSFPISSNYHTPQAHLPPTNAPIVELHDSPEDIEHVLKAFHGSG